MNRLSSVVVACGMILLVGSIARGQNDKPLKDQVVGTWVLVSEVAHKGGETSMPLGTNPLGQMMFDRNGRFMMIIARPDLHFHGSLQD